MKLTDRDSDAIMAFGNFLSWQETPYMRGRSVVHAYRRVPPAWYAYAMGLTKWCPPWGEM